MHTKKTTTAFLIAAAITLLICIWGIAFPASFTGTASTGIDFLTKNFAWLFCLSMVIFVVFCVWIGFFSKYRHMRLGPDESRPEHSDLAWFSMLFSAGIGVGLVFWGAAEPLSFFVSPIDGIQPGSAEAAKFALTKAFFHWGIHPWAGYAALALALAFMQFRRNKPALISSVFIPLIGEKRAGGWLGQAIDILALIATAGGVATSLRLGTLQINSGLSALLGVQETLSVQILLLLVLAAVYIITSATNIDRTISLISGLNVKIAVGLMALLIVLGPTVPILNHLFEGIGAYLAALIPGSFTIGAFSNDGDWYRQWTIFYWAWWISWAPFTGSFIARISKGRTIGEFIRGVMLLPAGFSVVWFSVFGTLGMELDFQACKAAVATTSGALFAVLEHYPLGKILCVLVLILICTFFITFANSATCVLGMYSEGGCPTPSNRSKIVWGALMAALGVVMLISDSNGLAVVSAFPFTFVMLAAVVSILTALRQESLH